MINAIKVIPENLFSAIFGKCCLWKLWEMRIYKLEERPITVKCSEGCVWSPYWFIKVNFSKLNSATKFSGMTLYAFIITSVEFKLKLLTA